MVRFGADENLSGSLVRALRRKLPSVDIMRVQDVGLRGANDDAVLAWAASESRVLLTHDVNTIPHFAYERMRNDLPVGGVILVPDLLPIAKALDDLLLIAQCSAEGEFDSTLLYLPLR